MKISKLLGAGVTIIGVGFFMFTHFASSAETAATAEVNKAYIEQLRDIHINQDTADEATRALTLEMCLNGKLIDKNDCAKVGVKVENGR